jgi:transcriptional regulator with XRE-family HTH domain
MTVGQKIKKYLNDNNISQADFSIAVKMVSSKLNLVLNGHRKLQIEEYAVFCDALGVPFDTFLEKRNPGQNSEKKVS